MAETLTQVCNMLEMLNTLHKAVLDKYRPSGGDFINKQGIWESWWDSGHGSGLTDYHGDAPPDVIALDKAFDLIFADLRARKEALLAESRREDEIRREVEKEVRRRYVAEQATKKS